MLPPDDLPPLTHAQMLDEDERKLLITLEYKYKEFFNVGRNLSEKADMMTDILSELLSNLSKSVVDKFPDQGLAFTILTTKIITSTTILSKLDEPISDKMPYFSKMTILDIRQTFFELQNTISNPTFNQAFKARAIQCVLLTLAYGKLQNLSGLFQLDKDQENLFFNLFIAPLQRLAQIGLFAKDALHIFSSFSQCNKLNHYDSEFIKDILLILTDLINRSELIGKFANKMQECINLVAMETVENRFSEAALKQLNFFEELVCKFVPLIMESKDTSNILDQLNMELTANLSLKSANLYHDVCKLINNTPLELSGITLIKNKLKHDLCVIHESREPDNIKLKSMHQLILDTYNTKIIVELNNLVRSISYLFSPPSSDFEKGLKQIIMDDRQKNIPDVINSAGLTLR
jgi:hypothetical protein